MEYEQTIAYSTSILVYVSKITSPVSTKNSIRVRYKKKYSVSRTIVVTSKSQVLNINILITIVNLINEQKMEDRVSEVQTRSEMYVIYSKIEHLLRSYLT